GNGPWYYRVMGKSFDLSAPYFSRVIRVPGGSQVGAVPLVAELRGNTLLLKFAAEQHSALGLVLYSAASFPVKKMAVEMPAGISTREIFLPQLPPVYIISTSRGQGGDGIFTG